MGKAESMEVVNASSGGDGFHGSDWVLAYGAVFLGRGMPQLEHGVLGKPLDLAPLDGVILGSCKEKLEDLRVGRPRATARRIGRRQGKDRPERHWGGAARGKESEVA